MKSTLLILLGICLGWFLNNFATKADAREDYHDDLKWAAFAAFDIVGVLVISALL